MRLIIIPYALVFCYFYLLVTPKYIALVQEGLPANKQTFWQAIRIKKIKFSWPSLVLASSLFSILLWLSAEYRVWSTEPVLMNLNLGFVCFSTLLILAKIDKKTYLLPDVLTLPLWFIGCLFIAKHSLYTHLWSSLTVFFIGAFFSVISQKLTQRIWLGLGDVKLLAALCAWLGLSLTVTSIFVASVLVLFHTFIKKGKKTTVVYVPFGPYLIYSAIFSFFTTTMI